MSFLVEFGQSGGQEVVSVADKVTDSLGKVEDASGRVRDTLGKMGASGTKAGEDVSAGLDQTAEAARRAAGGIAELDDLVLKLGASTKANGADGLAGFTGREIAMLEQINGPMREHIADIDALNKLVSVGAIPQKAYEDQLVRLEHQYGATNRAESLLAQSLEQEEKTLQRIRGPMQAYEQEVATLERLHKQGKLTADEYQAELDKQAKKAGVWQGPLQQNAGAAAQRPAAETQSTASQLFQGVAPQAGPAGQLISGLAAGGAIAVGATVGAVVSLGYAVAEVSDKYTELSNRVVQFTQAGQTANEIIGQQATLADQLHTSLDTASELYVRVRESTNELNLSTTQQLELARELGSAVVASGHDASDATALARRLSLAFETGTVSGRELRAIMKEYPEIAKGFAESLGHPQRELVALANKGEISAQQIIGAFDKMAPHMEALVAEQPRTYSRMWHDAIDSVTKAWGDAAGALSDPAIKAAAKVARSYEAQLDAIKRLGAEEDKHARLAPIIAAANKVGIETGPYDQAIADKVSAMRMVGNQIGIEVPEAFDQATSKATMFETKLNEIKEKKASEDIARDVKRIWDAMNGGDEIFTKQMRHWQDMADQIGVLTKAIQRWKDVTPMGTPTNQEQRDLERQLTGIRTEQNATQYGAGVLGAEQAKNKAREALEDYTRAAKAGVISSEALRKQYEATMTTLNDGRLPETIKWWDSFHLPFQQFQRDIKALDYLLNTNKITWEQWRASTQAAAQTAGQGDLWKILDQHITPLKPDSQANAFAQHQALVAQQNQQDTLGEPLIEPARQYEQRLRAVQIAIRDIGLDQQAANVLQRQARDAFDSTADAIHKATVEVSGYQEHLAKLAAQRDAGTLTDQQFQASVAQLDREAKLMEQFAQPAATYKQALEDIAGAQHNFGLSTSQVTVLQRQAREAFQQSMEALSGHKELVKQLEGPYKTYAKDIAEANEAMHDGDISATQYARAVDKIKLTLLTTSIEGNSFVGGMEAGWIRLKQEADAFGATLASQVLGDVDKLNQTLVTAANGGQVSWSQMADSMIQDLERVALKALEVKAIEGIMNIATGGEGGSAAGMLAGLGDGLMHNASGGMYKIGGSGTTDSKIAQTYITPGEYMRVYTPQQFDAEQRAPATQPQQRPPEVHIHNHMDTTAVTSALASRDGQVVISNALRKLNIGMRR